MVQVQTTNMAIIFVTLPLLLNLYFRLEIQENSILINIVCGSIVIFLKIWLLPLVIFLKIWLLPLMSIYDHYARIVDFMPKCHQITNINWLFLMSNKFDSLNMNIGFWGSRILYLLCFRVEIGSSWKVMLTLHDDILLNEFSFLFVL